MSVIDEAIQSVSDLSRTIVVRYWPDASEKERLIAERIAAEMAHEFRLILDKMQLADAAQNQTSIFHSSWRPFLGWTCGVSVAYVALLEPIARFFSVVLFGYTGAFPPIDTDLTLQVLMMLLGLAGIRSYEKSKGVARS